jgi:hypothetical protein
VRNVVGATEELIVSNFGLNADLRCLVALKKTAYAFGKFERILSERATFDLVKESATDCDEFIDVGANEGAFTLSCPPRPPPGAIALA